MKKKYIPFLFLLLLCLLAAILPFSFDRPSSVVRAWHTTVVPQSLIIWFVIIAVCIFDTIGYWLIARQTAKVNWVFFIVHAAFTIPTIIFIKLPFLFINAQQIEIAQLITQYKKWRSIAWLAFIAGQSLFFLYYMRIIQQHKRITADA